MGSGFFSLLLPRVYEKIYTRLLLYTEHFALLATLIIQYTQKGSRLATAHACKLLTPTYATYTVCIITTMEVGLAASPSEETKTVLC